jgi:hypothetical protein
MDTPDKSEYVVAGIAAIILLEALTVALVIAFFFGRALRVESWQHSCSG